MQKAKQLIAARKSSRNSSRNSSMERQEPPETPETDQPQHPQGATAAIKDKPPDNQHIYEEIQKETGELFVDKDGNAKFTTTAEDGQEKTYYLGIVDKPEEQPNWQGARPKTNPTVITIQKDPEERIRDMEREMKRMEIQQKAEVESLVNTRIAAALLSQEYRSNRSSRAGSRQSSRRSSTTSSRRSSRANSPDRRRREEQQETARPLPQIYQQNRNRKHQDYTSIITSSSLMKAFTEMKTGEEETYQSFLETFTLDWDELALPKEDKLKIKVALKLMPPKYRNLIKKELIEIDSWDQFQEFLYRHILQGKSEGYCRARFAATNQMAEGDTNFSELLERIKNKQVPLLLSLREEYHKQDKAVQDWAYKELVYDLYSEAIPESYKEVAIVMGTSKNIDKLFQSCNNMAEAKLEKKNRKSSSRKETPKRISFLSNIQEEGTTAETIKKLQQQINNLKAQPKHCRNHPNATNHTTGECWNQGFKREERRQQEMYQQDRNFMRQEQMNQQDRNFMRQEQMYQPDNTYVINKWGKKNYCKYCIPNRQNVDWCHHCWTHSTLAKGIIRKECQKCQYKHKLKDKEEEKQKEN